MVIKFQCPSGHQLSAPENMAGKNGKCPKCNTPFVVPAPEDSLPPGRAGTTPVGDSAASDDKLATDSSPNRETPAMGSGKGTGLGEIFVFLCPNGHKLNGPPTLKGKAGKCPHCGAKFRIPTDDEMEAPEEEEVPAGESQEEGYSDGEQQESGGFHFNFGQEGEEVIDAALDEPLSPPPLGPAGLGYICGRLWDYKDDETEIEIFLTEGEIMSPDHFSEVLSSSDYGVFANREADGNYAVTVIPWSAVRRVGVRKMYELPAEMFR